MEPTTQAKKIPRRIFLVPYRNRIQHKFFFLRQMQFLLEDMDPDEYEIYFSHPCDTRAFNRGATRNIGFLAMKQKYPNHYHQMTFIFHDIDTLPFHKIFDYETVPGVVKHYYGYTYALGGIVVIKGQDFEKINGYPCYWGWGMEDNTLQKRCLRFGLTIDRSTFFKIGSPEMLQLFDGISRIISRNDPWRSETDKGTDGLITIRGLNFSIANESLNPSDNVFTVENMPNVFYINIMSFVTETPYESQAYFAYDLRQPKRQIIRPTNDGANNHQHPPHVTATMEDWTHIPYYPTVKERRLQYAQRMQEQTGTISPQLLQQLERDQRKEIQSDVFNRHLLPDKSSSSSSSSIATPSSSQTKSPQVLVRSSITHPAFAALRKTNQRPYSHMNPNQAQVPTQRMYIKKMGAR